MKIAVAMSGGVDSSAAAAILKEQGHDLVGFSMQLWNQKRGLNVDANGEPLPSRCCSLDDIYDARRVASDLSFPFYVLNLERDFEQAVIQPFITSYLSGETPIPCVACNSRLKFASLDRLAQSLGCDKVATGHYARIKFDEKANCYRLLRGLDTSKDQSYFLWELTQEQLARAMFPLGEMGKAEVRATARRHNLSVAEKAESQEICFVPDGNYAGFIDRYLEAEGEGERTPDQGEIVNTRGEFLGRHSGIHRYTVGQRRGLGVNHSRPLYVLSINHETNQVVVGTDEELLSTQFLAAGVNWVACDTPTSPISDVQVRVRYRHTAAPATVEMIGDKRARVTFETPQRAVTPGQATVFYRGDEVVGGGWIVKR